MSDPELTLLTVPLSSTLANAGLALRRQVFVLEQHVPADEEFDSYDLSATHVVAVLEGDVVGVLRILFLPEHVKIGRVAVQRERRGLGIARKMMLYAMDFARARGETRFYLTAQTDKIGLYEQLGYVAFGEQFQDGGMPHFAMKTY